MSDRARVPRGAGSREIRNLLHWHYSGRAWKEVLDPTGLALYVSGVAGFATVMLEFGLWTRSPSWFLPILGHPTLLGILVLSAIPSSLLGSILHSQRSGSGIASRGWSYASGLPLVGLLLIAWYEVKLGDRPGKFSRAISGARKEEANVNIILAAGLGGVGRIHEWVRTFPGPCALALALLHAAQALGWVAWLLEHASRDRHVFALAILTAVSFHGLLFAGLTLALRRQEPLELVNGAGSLRRYLPWLSWLPVPLLLGYFGALWWLRDIDRTLIARVYKGQWRGLKPEAKLPRYLQPPSRAGMESRFFRVAALRMITGFSELFTISYAFFAWTPIDVDQCVPFVLAAWIGMLAAFPVGLVPLVPWGIGRLARWTAASLGLFGTVLFLAGLSVAESASSAMETAGHILLIASIIAFLALMVGKLWVDLGDEVAVGRTWAFLSLVVGYFACFWTSTDAELSAVLVTWMALWGWLPSACFAVWALRRRWAGDPAWPLGLPGACLALPFLAVGHGGTRCLRRRRTRSALQAPDLRDQDSPANLR